MFVHLHVHSRYSLLDGLADVADLVAMAKAMNMPAVALTDHGVLYGLVAFYRAAHNAGITPILGMEAYFTPDHRVRRKDAPIYHLLLLAYNDQGLRNLFVLATKAQLEGFYQKPRIDFEWLAQHHEGLITTTGCLSGIVPDHIKRERLEEAEKHLRWFIDLFGRERFFVELQRHDDVPELERVNRVLVSWARKYDLPLLATNDVHYLRPEDAARHDVLLAIQTGKSLDDPKRMRMGGTYYFRSPEEMQQLFAEVPEALSNTLRVAEMAQDLQWELNSLREKRGLRPQFFLPRFEPPNGETPEAMLRRLVEEGLRRRYGPRADDPEVRARMEEELDVIHRMGFDTYFLIVWDIVRFAREQGIWTNARGSAGGSLVAYALGITMVDPLEYDLLFERFLNADRMTMPDIDLDFPDDRRDVILQYLKDKYGEDKVAQIITFGTVKARMAVRDVGRIMGVPLQEVDRLAKAIPHIPSKPVTLKEALFGRPKKEDEEEEDTLHLPVPELVEAYKQEPYKTLLDTAVQMEGVIRNVGTHAAGVVVTPDPLIEHIPLHRPTSDNQESPIRAVTQFEMGDLEDLGLLKVDVLGLATFTVMQRACDLIRARHGKEYTLETIPIDDPEAYRLLGRGETAGIFQVEGRGMTRYLVAMQPKELRHVIAMVALYRPGPMRFIEPFIRRMHGKEEVTYLHPSLEPIYGETYGFPVYQEQVMLAARRLAGFTGPEADHLRRAIAKKKRKLIPIYREKFIKGAVERGIPQEVAEAIFEEWRDFASYAFNKSHAATYAMIAVQTAYLKAHYPLEYMTALLSVYMHDTDKVAAYVADCRRMGIPVLPPDINHSHWEFTIEKDPATGKEGIRFGLGAVKNVARQAVDALLEARAADGPFRSLGDLMRRVNLRKQVGKRSLESLIRVGALDAFGNRKALLAALDALLAASDRAHRARARGQLALFAVAGNGEEMDDFELPRVDEPLSLQERMTWERELTGVFLSEHPLAAVRDALAKRVTFSTGLSDLPEGRAVTVAGVISQVETRRTSRGQTMAYALLEDLHGQIELILFPKTWTQYQDLCQIGRVVMAWGRVKNREVGVPRVVVDRMSTEIYLEEPAAEETLPETPVEELEEVAPLAVEPAAPAMPVSPKPAPEPEAVDAAAPRTNGAEHTAQAPAATAEAPQARRLVITIRAGDDVEREARRLERLHRWLTEFPGQDRFSWVLYVPEGMYVFDFPNQTTGICPELLERLEAWGLQYEVVEPTGGHAA